MSPKDQPDGENLLPIGDYRPPEAERLLDALIRANIKFEIECDDGIRFAARRFGSFGNRAKISVWIDAKETKRVRKIQADLFPESPP